MRPASWPMFGGSPARSRFVASKLRPPFRIVQTIPGESLIEMPPAVVGRAGRLRDARRDGHRCTDAGRREALGEGHRWLHRLVAGRPGRDRVHRLVRPGAVRQAQGRKRRSRRARPEHGTAALALRRWERRGEPCRRGRQALLLRLPEPEAVSGLLDEARPEPADRLELRAATKVASSPALFGRRLYISAYDRSVYGFDGWSGRLRWRASAFSDDAEMRVLLSIRSLVKRRSWWEGGYYATPAVSYGRIYVGVIDGVFSAFDTETGEHRWSGSSRLDLRFRRAVEGDRVRRNDGRDVLRALGPHGSDALAGAAERKDPRVTDRNQRTCLRVDNQSRDVRPQRSHGQDRVAVLRTATTRRSSSPAPGLPRRQGADLHRRERCPAASRRIRPS